MIKCNDKHIHKNFTHQKSSQSCANFVLALTKIFANASEIIGFLLIISSLSHAQIIGNNAQTPEINHLANGAIQINIRHPNESGLSHNIYQQFDIPKAGAILNNSANAIHSQLGDMINGNSAINVGHEAKVILNEINSYNPSHLKGLLEVAGPRADVIVANPSGITCNGCGFINSHQAILTTGQPIIEKGQLESFIVRQGKIHFEGAGMNAKDTSKAAFLARAIVVNANLFAKKLVMGTGQNQFSADSLSFIPEADTEADASISQGFLKAQFNSLIKEEKEKPSVALDVSELGGMYAGHIYLIGTKTGLGVRHRGEMIANIDNLALDTNSHLKLLEESNSLEAKIANIDINDKGIVQNIGGTIHSHGDLIISSANILNDNNLENNKEGKIDASNISIKTGSLINRSLIKGDNVILKTGIDNYPEIKDTTDNQFINYPKNNSDSITNNQTKFNEVWQKPEGNICSLNKKPDDYFLTKKTIESNNVRNHQYPMSLVNLGQLIIASEPDASNHQTNRTDTIDNFSDPNHFRFQKLKASKIDNAGGVISAQNQLVINDEALVKVKVDTLTSKKINHFFNENSFNLKQSIGQKIGSISEIFLDTPYITDALYGSENEPEKLIVDFRGLDCITYIDYVESLQKSQSKSEFIDNLIHMRYIDGQTHYLKRKHFFSDWAYRNHKIADDVTSQISPHATIIEKNLNEKNTNETLLSGLPIVKRNITYIPSQNVHKQVLDLLQTGDYIGVYSHLNGLDASHAGIFISDTNDPSMKGPVLRHASSRKDNQRVINSPFIDYVTKTPGIIVLRANSKN